MVGTSLATLVLVIVLAGCCARTTATESGCKYITLPNFYCTNIKEFPKDIHENATAVRIEASILNGSTFENIVVPASVRILQIHDCTLKGLKFENMVLPATIKELRITDSKIEKNIGVFKPNKNLQLLKITLINKGEINNKFRIEPGAFDYLTGLLHLDLSHNQLKSFPVFKIEHKRLRELHLSQNNIKEFKLDQHLSALQKLYMKGNKLTALKNDMFPSGNKLEILDLSDNPINRIEAQAFKNFKNRFLRTLVLNDIYIEKLPTEGLGKLVNLSLKGVDNLFTIPAGLDSIRKVDLAEGKAFLCCKIIDNKRAQDTGPRTFPTTPPTTPANGRVSRGLSTIPPGFGRRKRRVLTAETPNMSATVVPSVEPYVPVDCTPRRTAFEPCENLMGADWLTAVSFIVAPFALCGNFVVILVFLCLARNYNVSRFLVTNLAIADMCMGIYLLSLVIESVITAGEYYQHVERFQFGLSCKVLGFLAMFSSELSVFSLTLITVERYMTIVYAMYPKRRLTMRTAIVCMAFGWIVAITVGLLPIFGVGGYGKVAICLPFDTANGGGLYLCFVFGINGVSFLFICALYAQIYRSVFKTSNSTPTRGHDSRVARRMAILVFTDLACFAPIAIAGISALLGHALIDVTQSKYLLVFFFPLNALLNPFLYAIITKTFRRDLAALLKNCFVCGDTLTTYLSAFPARSVQSTNDVLSPSARPSIDLNSMDLRSLGNIRGSRENPISASFSKSEPNLVRFSQE